MDVWKAVIKDGPTLTDKTRDKLIKKISEEWEDKGVKKSWCLARKNTDFEWRTWFWFGKTDEEPEFLEEFVPKKYLSENEELCKQYQRLETDPPENPTLPETIKYHSNLIAVWLCSICGYIWKTSMHQRSIGQGCANCEGCVINDKNNLKTTRYWKEYIKLDKDLEDAPTPPEKVFRGSTFPAWWKCGQCEQIYLKTPGNRLSKGCANCAGNIINFERSVANTKVADEYVRLVSDKGDQITPSEKIFANSGFEAEWKCRKCGHTWFKTPQSRNGSGTGCPECSLNFEDSMASTDYVDEYICLVGETKETRTEPRKLAKYTRKRALFKCRKCLRGWDIRIDGRTTGNGCPHCKSSKLEKIISKELVKIGINFEIGFKLPIKKVTGYISIDFILEGGRIFIEGDGIQHFEFNSYLHKGKIEEFEDQVRRDIKVNKYMKKKGYRLLRVAYLDIDDIHEILEKFLKSDEQIVFSDPKLYEETYSKFIALDTPPTAS
jgi:very-short-patch-repair endonuclease